MNKQNLTVVFYIVTILFIGVVKLGASSPSGIGSPVHFTIEPVSQQKNGGKATLELTMTPWDDRFHKYCQELIITVLPQGRVEYYGAQTWQESFTDTDTVSRLLDISIPPNDTSALFLRYECSGTDKSLIIRYFFVAKEDTTEFWGGDPRGHHPFPKQSRKENRKGNVIPGEFPEEDSLYGIPEQTERLILDSNKVINFETGEIIEKKDLPSSEQQKPDHQITIEELRKREKTPCAGVTGERIRIGDEVWVRKQGEYKYRRAVPATELNTKLLRIQKESKEKKGKVTHHITMD